MITFKQFITEQNHVVYHGTNTDFDTFEYRKAGMGNDPGLRGRGFYFTPDIRTARNYGSIVKKYSVTIKKPFIPSEFKSADEIADKLNIDTGMFRFNPSNGEFTIYNSYAGSFTSALRDAGYDGVVYPQRKEVVAFDPKQIREIK